MTSETSHVRPVFRQLFCVYVLMCVKDPMEQMNTLVLYIHGENK